MRKGIFWVVIDDEETNLISVTAECDVDGTSIDPDILFSSKSGDNFNHKIEWSRLPRSVTKGKLFNYYPRGRVEIKNGKVKIYINPDVYNDDLKEMIIKLFDLLEHSDKIRVVIDNSAHYQYSRGK